MNLHIARRKREFEEEHQPDRKRGASGASGDVRDVTAPTGLGATRLTEPDAERPWWVGRPLPADHDESDEPTSLPAA
jgi:hypothetical protein